MLINKSLSHKFLCWLCKTVWRKTISLVGCNSSLPDALLVSWTQIQLLGTATLLYVGCSIVDRIKPYLGEIDISVGAGDFTPLGRKSWPIFNQSCIGCKPQPLGHNRWRVEAIPIYWAFFIDSGCNSFTMRSHSSGRKFIYWGVESRGCTQVIIRWLVSPLLGVVPWLGSFFTSEQNLIVTVVRGSSKLNRWICLQSFSWHVKSLRDMWNGESLLDGIESPQWCGIESPQ